MRVPENKKNEPQPQPERRRMSWWKILFYSVVALCLVAIIVFASMLLTQKDSRSSPFAQEADASGNNGTSVSGDSENSNPYPGSGSLPDLSPSPGPAKPPSNFGSWVGPGGGGGNDSAGSDGDELVIERVFHKNSKAAGEAFDKSKLLSFVVVVL